MHKFLFVTLRRQYDVLYESMLLIVRDNGIDVTEAPHLYVDCSKFGSSFSLPLQNGYTKHCHEDGFTVGVCFQLV